MLNLNIKLLIILSFITWAVALTWTLYDEGIIQIGGNNFKLQPTTTLTINPVKVYAWDQITQTRKD